ncbi:uncharacterized protein LOC142765762 [Rhipicephalus microplus]|uniref:uncharacterized protein LOC142765762 n=1 Tax=Rhipicephalus microplus TaxID=6941 RepID=UPI003F6AEB0F
MRYASRTWTKALGSAASYLALIRGQQPGGSGRADKDVTPTRPLPERLREPRSTEVEREHGVFDSCLRTLVLSRGLEPLPLPQNLSYLNFSFGRFTVREGNLTGLSSVYRSGDCALVLGECGLSLRLDLGFEDLLVKVVAALSDHSSAGTTVLDFAIPTVEMSLDIAEINGQLEILSYSMLFLAPVKVTTPLLNPDGSANAIGVAPEVRLNDQDLEELKSSVRKCLQQLIHGVENSIAGSS